MYKLFISAVQVIDNNDFKDGDPPGNTICHRTNVYLAGKFYRKKLWRFQFNQISREEGTERSSLLGGLYPFLRN